MNNRQITGRVKQLAAELGFERCGIAPAERIGRADYVHSWLEQGRAGSMQYLHRHLNQRVDPRELLPGARSVIVAAFLYHQQRPARTDHRNPHGSVAMYAWGDDYHDVIKSKLFRLAERVQTETGVAFRFKACVDTAPLVERELAARAGIGWIGKNTLVLNDDLGSYFFLGELITTLELEADEPMPDHCGTCTACLQACPTNAFPAPYEMDATRCISYLTIEHRGDIPEALQPRMGDWIFGCDVCQEVCPFNRHAPTTLEPRFSIRRPGPDPPLEKILGWSLDDYRNHLRGSAMKRATLDMLRRNAAIAKRNVTEASTCTATPNG